MDYDAYDYFQPLNWSAYLLQSFFMVVKCERAKEIYLFCVTK